MKRINHVIMITLCSVLALQCSERLSDLRTVEIKQRITAQQKQKGRALLDKLAEINGTINTWQSAVSIRAEYEVDWPSVLKTVRQPNSTLFLHIWMGFRNRSILTFRNGDNELDSIGIANGLSYTEPRGQKPVFKQNEDILFWLPTMQYFIELAFLISEAEIVAFAGERTLGKQDYDLVFATWQSAEPRQKLDQYLLWLNKAGQVEFVQYTVRDKSAQALGTVYYESWKKYGGLNFPAVFKKVKSPEDLTSKGTVRVREVKLF